MQQSHRVQVLKGIQMFNLLLSPPEGLHIKDPSFRNLKPVGINKA